MANGRLGSTVVNPYNAALVYSNTSGSAAAVNVQATSLSATTNARFSYAIDSATVSINQTTTWTTLSSGNVNYQLYWIDPISGTTPVRTRFTSKYMDEAEQLGQYWDGTAWTYSGTNKGIFGNFKLDPYFYTNYAEYNNKTSPTFYIPMTSPNTGYATVAGYNLNQGVTGLQLGKMLATGDSSNGATSTLTYQLNYAGASSGYDPYTDFIVGVGEQGYMTVWTPANPSTAYQRSTDGVLYNFYSSSYQYGTVYWYAPRIIASNGFFIMQSTPYSTSYFAIGDVESALLSPNPNYCFWWASGASGAKWSMFNGSGSGYDISWFEWNPNTQKFYMEYIGGGNHKIYSATKAQIRAVQNGNSSSVNISSVFTLESGSTPWTSSSYIMAPRRIGQSLWQAASNNGNTYVSTDLVNWTVSTTFWTAQGLPSSTTIFSGLTSTSYIYAGSGVANINRFSSGYSSVSQNAVVENQTTFGNYQRSGLVLSAGDKLYCQNYGTAAYSIYVMGYEG